MTFGVFYLFLAKSGVGQGGGVRRTHTNTHMQLMENLFGHGGILGKEGLGRNHLPTCLSRFP